MDAGRTGSANTSALIALLRDCTVQVLLDGTPRGSGFLVAPGLVLTCSHVVEGEGSLAVQSKIIKGIAHIRQRTSTGYPDLALLTFSAGDHPCALLDLRYAVGDSFYGWGFAHHGVARPRFSMESLLGHVEGWSLEDGDPERELIKLKGSQVVPGASGSPILNLQTGGVCGVLSETRSAGTDLGGYAVPVSVALGMWKELLTAPHNQFHRQDLRWFEALASARARQPRPDGDQELRQIRTSLEALVARVGPLQSGSRAEAATQNKRRWTNLYFFTFLLRDFDSADEVNRSIIKIFYFAGLGIKERLGAGRFEQFTFLSRLKQATAGGQQVKVLEIMTHRPEMIRTGFRAYRSYLETLFGLPDDPARFAERGQALLEIQRQLDQRMEGWSVQNVPGVGGSYRAIRAKADGGAQTVTFEGAPKSTNVADYSDKVTTTSEALELLVSLLEAPPIMEINLQTANLALLNLYAAMMDQRDIDLGRVIFNVDYPEQWNYNYDPAETSLSV